MKSIRAILILLSFWLMSGLIVSADNSDEDEAWKVGSVSIVNLENEKGTFQIQISGVTGTEHVKEINAAVWSVEEGQDALKWYGIPVGEDGSGTVDVDIKDHNYSLGEYKVGIYVLDIDDHSRIAGSAQCSFEAEGADPVIKSIKENQEYQIDIGGFVVPGGVHEVKCAVWSEAEGKDDLQWYSMKEAANAVWSGRCQIADHKGLGKYNVEISAWSKGGKALLLGTGSFTTEVPAVKEMKVLDLDVEAGTFTVQIDGIEHEELAKELRVSIYSEKYGEDSLKWYIAEEREDGTYEISVDVKDHNYAAGKYQIQVYIVDITGASNPGITAEAVMDIKKGNLEIKGNDLGFTAALDSVIVPGGVDKVRFAVWSQENGLDDFHWYGGVKKDGKHSVDISVKKYKNLGLYQVRAYAITKNGKMILVGKGTFKTEQPSLSHAEIRTTDRAAGRFKVHITGVVNPELIEEIQVPVWSDKDQSDIVWYKASRDKNGEYSVDVDIKNHKYSIGVYNIHVYIKDITGALKYMVQTRCDMSILYASASVKDINGREETFRAEIKGLKVPAGETSVKFLAWGEENGQNDLKEYTASRNIDGTYYADIKIRNHRELGKYNVHVYCTTNAGAYKFITERSFEVKQKPQIAGVTISEINGITGTFKVTVTGVMAPSGIESVQIPIWSAGDQSDICWYTAVKAAEGVYYTVMDVKNHKYNFGNFNIHVYATAGNGIYTCVGKDTVKFDPVNYIYSNPIGAYQREIIIKGVPEGVHNIQFPTWSSQNGQNDIVWYQGTNLGSRTWSVVVDSGNHSHAGTYITHVYANGSVKLGETAYTLQWLPNDMRMMQAKANLYSSTTPYIILMNRSTHKVGVFQGWQGNWNCIKYWDCSDGKASTPTVMGVFKVGSRGYYFDSGNARCFWWTQFYYDYLFHSVLYNKNGTLQDGRLGMALSHGCVRLQIDNAKWIYDTIPSGTTVVVYQ